jgi:nitrogen fixation NifU-like protein
MMTAAVKGKTKEEAEAMFDEFHRMVKGDLDAESEQNHLGRLKIFAGVREYPARVKCASLSWHTLRAAIEQKDEGRGEFVTTEVEHRQD